MKAALCFLAAVFVLTTVQALVGATPGQLLAISLTTLALDKILTTLGAQ